jgi:archaellum component FlaC
MLNAAILKNMKGLPGEEDQRREVERLKLEFKNIKQLLSKVSQTIFSFQHNFERQI